MHCFKRKPGNDRKIWILQYCPKDVCPGLWLLTRTVVTWSFPISKGKVIGNRYWFWSLFYFLLFFPFLLQLRETLTEVLSDLQSYCTWFRLRYPWHFLGVVTLSVCTVKTVQSCWVNGFYLLFMVFSCIWIMWYLHQRLINAFLTSFSHIFVVHGKLCTTGRKYKFSDSFICQCFHFFLLSLLLLGPVHANAFSFHWKCKHRDAFALTNTLSVFIENASIWKGSWKWIKT